jgi:hypothetical protein
MGKRGQFTRGIRRVKIIIADNGHFVVKTRFYRNKVLSFNY